MSKLTPIALAPAASLTATYNNPGVEISDFTGNAQLILDANQPAAGQTLDVKLQHSRDNGSTDAWADAGVSFNQVTNAGGASYQVQDLSVDGLKKYVRVVSTIAGSATALARGVYMVGNLAK